MKYFILLCVLTLTLSINAQQIEKDGKNYKVKKEKIYLNNEDVTETLTPSERSSIFLLAAKYKKEQDQLKLVEKETKKLEKAQKKAKKETKRAKKKLKQQAKAKKGFDKAETKLSNAQKKYKRLKDKGKLSPVEEQDWLDKIDKLSRKADRAKKKL